MKHAICISLLSICISFCNAQLSVRYDLKLQPTSSMQYFHPKGDNLFVGDCIPFYHEGTYFLYWLIDSAHHSALGGLGGHQWVLSTSKDLKTWINHPIVLGIDEEWEKSICTGSVVYYNKKFYAYYATRLLTDAGVNEQLSYAISDDGIHFIKQKPNPFYTSAPGYSKRDFRDPKVEVDADGTFHLFVSSKEEKSTIKGLDGALVHLTSKDFKNWKVEDPLITGQKSVPECPDYFKWNNWYYLVYSDNGNTFYVKSKNRYGPWEQPAYQALNEDWSNVVKTAEFIKGRRIAAGWVPSRKDDKDDGHEIFGGNIVFREVTQAADGTLNTKFPKELIPETDLPLRFDLLVDQTVKKSDEGSFSIIAPNGIGASHINTIPSNCRITLQIVPKTLNEEYGLILRSDSKGDDGYKLSFSANDYKVTLGNTEITGVSGLNKAIQLDVIIKDGIMDVSIDNKRCIVNRGIEQKGNTLWFYAKHGTIEFKSIKISALRNN